MNANLLDTLVKLASLGTSGVCVLSIFWSGWLLNKLPTGHNQSIKDKASTLRFYMIVSLVTATVSAIAGFLELGRIQAAAHSETAKVIKKAEPEALVLPKAQTDSEAPHTHPTEDDLRREVLRGMAINDIKFLRDLLSTINDLNIKFGVAAMETPIKNADLKLIDLHRIMDEIRQEPVGKIDIKDIRKTNQAKPSTNP